MKTNPNIRVRIAPSPTGNLHIGTLRSALFNYLFAKNMGGTFILRIEDTDRARSKTEFENNIIEGLDWLELTPDEGPIQGGPHGPYRQSERLDLYQNYAQILLAQKKAYRCFCTEAELDAERAQAERTNTPYTYSQKCKSLSDLQCEDHLKKNTPYTLKFELKKDTICQFSDLIRGEIQFDLNLLSDFVIIKSDGTPSYNFAVVVDDLDMKISHIIRGEDHISNTPRQIAIYEALNVTPPQFAHLPMILGEDRSKLSKRHGATSITDYRDLGYLTKALQNYLTLLGWSSPDGQEIMTLDEIITQFSLSRISKSGAIFDITKLKWMNGQYIRKCTPSELYSLSKPFFNKKTQTTFKALTQDQVEKMVYAIKDNLDVLTDINTYLEVFTCTEDEYKQNLIPFPKNDTDTLVLETWITWLNSQKETLTPNDIQSGLDHLVEVTKLPKGKIFKPIRIACSGYGNGPHLPDLLSLISKETLRARCAYRIECL